MSSFILGIEESVPGAAYRSTEELYNMVGHNTGNLAFHHAISNIIGGKIPSVSWYAGPSVINMKGDVGIMPCANQLGSHANYGGLGDQFSKLDVKLVAIGLGAQGGSTYDAIPEVPDGTLRWLKEIVSRSPKGKANITVRGPFTRRVLEHYGFGDYAVTMGCPTLFLNPDPNLGKKVEARLASPIKHVAVAAGHQAWKHLGRLEASLTRIMMATHGAYIVQSPMEMVSLGRGAPEEVPDHILEQCRDYAAPELTMDEFKIWSKRYARSFFDIPAWMEYLRRFDLVVGVRIHGCMLALQAGIPVLCVAHDSRTRELCEVMKIPFVMASEVSAGLSRSALEGLVQFDGDEFDKNRRSIGRNMRSFMRENGISISPVFDALMPVEAE